MIKRPLCLTALLFLIVQAIVTIGFNRPGTQRPSGLELNIGRRAKTTVEGTVCRREIRPDYQLLYLEDNIVHLKNQIYHEPKILVYLKTENQPRIGNRIEIQGEGKTFEEARNPGNFNQKLYYQKQNMHVSVWSEEMKVLDTGIYRVREGLTQVREKWKALLIDSMGSYYGNSMSAILLGDKSELDPELKSVFQKSGIGHILAISGLHMSFLGSTLYLLLRKMGVPFLIAGSLGSFFLGGYTLMIGAGVSSLRALVMFFVRIGADITGRDYDGPTSLTLAAAVIVAGKPSYLFDAGFLLSFGALFGIAFVYPCVEFWLCAKTPKGVPAQNQDKDEKKLNIKKIATNISKTMIKGFQASIALNLALLPIMLYFYFEFPLYSVILNLFIIPLMPVLLGIGIVGSLAALVSLEVSGFILSLCKILLFLYEKACTFSLSLPGSRIVTGQPGLGAIYVYYVLLILLCLHTYTCIQKRKRADRTRCVFRRGVKLLVGNVAIAGLVLILAFSFPCFGGDGKVEISMLDVGQGDGLYVKGAKGKSYFIDGGSSDVGSVGQYRIEPFLKSKGRGSLDYVFISHGDADHMNGIEELLDNQELGIRIRNLVLPPEELHNEALKSLASKALEKGTKVVTMKRGDRLEEDEMEIVCLAPSPDYKGEPGNAASMVLAVSYGDFDMLFTGDVEGEGERILEGDAGLSTYEVLKVAHHGSKNSTTDKFLSRTKSGIALISAGIQNRYGHPHKETVELLDRAGCKIYSTQDNGAVTITTDGRRVKIEPYVERGD